MKRSRQFTAFSPVALRLGVCALIAACVILPVTPPFAAGPASVASDTRNSPVESLVFIGGRAVGNVPIQAERSGKGDRLAPRANAACSARHWDHEGACYLPATDESPARAVRIVTFERRDGNVSTLERRAVSSFEAK